MNILIGINRFLNIINENWTTIVVMIGLVVGIYQKIRSYLQYSKEERVAIAKAQIRESILSMITKAELDFADWNQAGSIKRSQVIQQIYTEYPILSKVIDQNALIGWIDDEINQSLKTLVEVTANNEDKAALE